jgi:hypothetical protein
MFTAPVWIVKTGRSSRPFAREVPLIGLKSNLEINYDIKADS